MSGYQIGLESIRFLFGNLKRFILPVLTSSLLLFLFVYVVSSLTAYFLLDIFFGDSTLGGLVQDHFALGVISDLLNFSLLIIPTYFIITPILVSAARSAILGERIPLFVSERAFNPREFGIFTQWLKLYLAVFLSLLTLRYIEHLAIGGLLPTFPAWPTIQFFRLTQEAIGLVSHYIQLTLAQGQMFMPFRDFLINFMIKLGPSLIGLMITYFLFTWLGLTIAARTLDKQLTVKSAFELAKTHWRKIILTFITLDLLITIAITVIHYLRKYLIIFLNSDQGGSVFTPPPDAATYWQSFLLSYPNLYFVTVACIYSIAMAKLYVAITSEQSKG